MTLKHAEKTGDITTVLCETNPLDTVRKYNDPKDYDEYRRLWLDSYNCNEVPDYPIQLDFELNYSCNYKCTMCTWSAENTSGRGKKTWLDFDVFKDIIDEGVEKGLKAINLSYINEPLIRSDIVQFIDYARRSGVLDIYFSTNGSLLTEKISRQLIQSGLTRIQVSIDAFTSNIYEKVRVGGNLKKVCKNILRFVEIRDNEIKTELPTMRVNFVRTNENKHELDQFIEYWKEKVDAIGIQDLVNVMEPNKSKHTSASKTFKCVQPFNHLTVRYNGHVLPCCTFFGAELPIAKLKSNRKSKSSYDLTDNIGLNNSPLLEAKDTSTLISRSIQEAWKSPEIELLRDIHRKGEYWKNPVCEKCVLSTSDHGEEPS